MAGKTKKPAIVKFPDPDGKDEVIAKLSLQPSANAAAVIQKYAEPFGDQHFGALIDELAGSIEGVQRGDMKQCEAMLMGQAQALQTMFMNLSRRALVQDYQKNLESFFRMAMKAQNQCRMTLETLATIKNPPVVFAKQANIAHGHQQVNNGLPSEPSPARVEKPLQPNELVTEGGHYVPTLDARGTASTVGDHPTMATVGEIDRAAD